MDAITARYNSLIEVLNSKQKKYIHFKSLGNFIQHLPEIEPEEDRRSCEKKIVDYLQVVEQSIDEVNSKFTTELYMNYIYPLGNAYKRIGFKKIIPIIYSLIFALGFDFFVGMIFLGSHILY